MSFFTHQRLVWVTLAAAILGQLMLNAYPQPAILLCGIALVAALLDGWWYLMPLGSRWWYPALLAVVGLTMWNQARGWFLMAWAVIEIGTGLRATSIWRRYRQAMAEEQARIDRLREMGFQPAASEDEEAAADEAEAAEPPAPLPPIAWYRYLLALLLGVFAAWIAAWCMRVIFYVTHFEADILAYFMGYMVARAVTMGARERSNRFLQGVAAVLGGASVVYGHILVLRYLLFEQVNQAYSNSKVVEAALQYPGKLLGIWLLLFTAMGVWSGWRNAWIHPDRQRG